MRDVQEAAAWILLTAFAGFGVLALTTTSLWWLLPALVAEVGALRVAPGRSRDT